jgi:hypothetical protein
VTRSPGSCNFNPGRVDRHRQEGLGKTKSNKRQAKKKTNGAETLEQLHFAYLPLPI